MSVDVSYSIKEAGTLKKELNDRQMSVFATLVQKSVQIEMTGKYNKELHPFVAYTTHLHKDETKRLILSKKKELVKLPVITHTRTHARTHAQVQVRRRT